MIPTDTDRAHRQRFDPNPDDDHLHLLRDSTRDHDGDRPTERRLDHAVGPIHIVRPLREASSDPNGVPIADDGLSAARGLIVGVALGAVCWAMIAGLISLLFF
jgi:hypothetical protein